MDWTYSRRTRRWTLEGYPSIYIEREAYQGCDNFRLHTATDSTLLIDLATCKRYGLIERNAIRAAKQKRDAQKGS